MKNHLKNTLKATSALALVATTIASASAENSTPNILVIVADDLGYGDLGCYGAPDILTPTLDKLAAEGIRFSNFHTTSSVSSPSRASMLTGKTCDKVGVPGVVRVDQSNCFGFLDPEAITLPQLLQANDYQTALIGKWHLGHEAPNLPTMRGFDHFKGWLVGMCDYYKHIRYDQNWMRHNLDTIETEGHTTDLFTQWAIEYIEQNKKNPFCVFLHYTAPHSPLNPATEYYQRVKQRLGNIDENRAKYIALVEHMDHNIGQVIKTLEQTQQLDNTLILFLSDNGGQLKQGANNGSLAGGKGSMYEGGTRIPLIARWKGTIAPAQVNDDLTSITDLMPTIAAATQTNIDQIKGLDGVNLLPLLTGENPDVIEPYRRIIYTRRGNQDTWSIGTVLYAVTIGQWKLMQHSPYEPFVFYNLAEDPGEQHPIDPKTLPKKAKNFEKVLKKHIVETGSVPWHE